MKRSTVIEAAIQSEPVEQVVQPADLIPLGALAAEGLGWGEFTRTPKGAVDALARQLGGQVRVDGIGRRAVSSDVARRLLEERAAAEERRGARRRRQAEEWAKRPRPVRGGLPAVPGLSALETMLANPDADEARKDAAAAKTAALLRGDLVGGRFSPKGER